MNGKKVRQLRTDKGLTLDQLAVLAKVSKSHLSDIENGIANPTVPVAIRIAKALRVKLEDLIGE